MQFRWLPKCEEHCRKHQEEAPEICPAFIEQVMEHGHPSRYYADRTYVHRYVFEGYFPPGCGRPYRVIFEVTEQQEFVPVACWRIRDREFRKTRPTVLPNVRKT